MLVPALNEIAHAVGSQRRARKATTPADDHLFLCARIGRAQIIWGAPFRGPVLGRRGPFFFRRSGRPIIVTAFACIVMRRLHGPSDMRFLSGRVCLGGRLVAVSVFCVGPVCRSPDGALHVASLMTIFMVGADPRGGLGQGRPSGFAPWEAIFVVFAIFASIMLVWTFVPPARDLPSRRQAAQPRAPPSGAYASGSSETRNATRFGLHVRPGRRHLRARVFSVSSPRCTHVPQVSSRRQSTFALLAPAACETRRRAPNFFNSRIVERIGMRRIQQAAGSLFLR